MHVTAIRGKNDVYTLQDTPTHSNTLQLSLKHPAAHTATHCNTFRSHTSKALMHVAAVRGENEAVSILQHTPTHSNTLQHTPTHSNALQRTAIHCNTLQHTPISRVPGADAYRSDCWRKRGCPQHTATHCNTQQHTATHCNTLQHTVTHCNTYLPHTCRTPMHVAAVRGEYKAVCTLRHTASHSITLQHTQIHCNTLQHTATHTYLTYLRRQCMSQRFVARTRLSVFCGT